MHSGEPTPRDLSALSRMRLFSKLPDQELARVGRHTQIRTAGRGELLFESGQQANSFFGVVSGWVKLFNRRADGTEAVLGIFTQGETFAEATLFMSNTYPATAEVVTPARLFEFERDFFEKNVLSNPELCHGMFASLSMHLHKLTREIERLQNQNSEQRLVRFLLMMCDGKDGACTVTLPYEKSLIATRLGMKPETLSRNFAKLKSSGVKVEKNKVIIGDIARLQQQYI